MLKTSLVYLLLALLIGLLQALSPVLNLTAQMPFLRQIEPVRVHLFVVGWISLLIFGVVIWMFPKYSREQPRGPEWLGWACYGLLNAGLALRVVGESAAQPGTVFGWLLVASALLQWLAALAFFINAWARVKEK